MLQIDDTIAAIATAAGPAGLAVVRVSGPGALAVADAVFEGAAPLAASPSHRLHHGWAAARGRRIDEVVAAVFRAPRSYTREDVVEWSCHGGDVPARRVLDALLAAGARLARPGEFTLRAFLHGRIDLAQAEAVADLIHAATEHAHDLALAQLAGGLSRALHAQADRLADLVAEVEARIDFAEDVGGVEVPAHVVDGIAAADQALAALLAGAPWARAVREGVRMPVVGRPNVGKSSLFNALLGEERAIVTPAPGTTRDRVSEAIEIAGVRVTLSDTAGLRATDEPVEAIGVGLAERAIEGAGLVLWVIDGSRPLGAEDRAVASRLAGRPSVVALNKRDLGRAVSESDVMSCLEDGPRSVVSVSAASGEGVDTLRGAIGERLGAGRGEAALGAAATNPRHVEALERARAALGRAAAVARTMPGEIVALELREALAAIGEVTGGRVGDDVLERIFARFCIGK